MKINNHTISPDDVGKRLDAFATAKLSSLTRSSVQKLIADGRVKVNNERVKTGYTLRKNDVVAINFDEDELIAIPTIDIPIVYEDDNCLVLNKPIGILTHSKGAFNPEATVATFIAAKVNDMIGDRAGIVHRLDRATSGIIICAKNPVALSWLQKQFSQRKTKKTYAAIISGGLEPKEALIDMPIERDPQHPKQFRVGTNGRAAQTAYRTIKSNSNETYSQLELKPVTGRTHQIRVHLKQVKHPIVGDSLYGGESFKRLMLHAQSLEITLPSHERKVFSAPIPKEFNDIMK